MARKQDVGDEPRALTDYMRAVRDGKPPEEVARLKALHAVAVAARYSKRQEEAIP